MRISDWSSDVCSSDLLRIGLEHEQARLALLVVPAEIGPAAPLAPQNPVRTHRIIAAQGGDLGRYLCGAYVFGQPFGIFGIIIVEIGRASCRERVCHYG